MVTAAYSLHVINHLRQYRGLFCVDTRSALTFKVLKLKHDCFMVKIYRMVVVLLGILRLTREYFHEVRILLWMDQGPQGDN